MKQAAGIHSRKVRFPGADTLSILQLTLLAQGLELSRQDAVYILVGLSMESSTNNTIRVPHHESDLMIEFLQLSQAWVSEST